MVEGARLESVFRGNSNVGSNPTLSAIYFQHRTESPIKSHSNLKQRSTERASQPPHDYVVLGRRTAVVR